MKKRLTIVLALLLLFSAPVYAEGDKVGNGRPDNIQEAPFDGDAPATPYGLQVNK